MASVISGDTEVDYSVNDGRVQSFVLDGVTLFDEGANISVEGWQDKLVEFIKEYRLDIDRDGHGLHAFVYRMQKDGLLSGDECQKKS